MNEILAVVFALSGYTNGVYLSTGIGFVDNESVYANPVGVIRANTSVISRDGWSVDINAAHISSIPDPNDTLYGFETNVVSIDFVVKIGG